MTDVSAHVAALLAARTSWCDLGDGRRLSVRRPAEGMVSDLRRGGLPAFCACVVGWEGFTHDDVYRDGNATPLPCEPELVREILIDRAEWVGKLVDHLRGVIEAHAEAAEARRKN